MHTRRRLVVIAALVLGCAALVVPGVPSQAASLRAAPAKPVAPRPAQTPRGTVAPDNHQRLISKPPMGWNERSGSGCDVSAQRLEQAADQLASSGLRDAGYRYVDIGDCWSQKTRGADGRLVPDATKFPDGMRAVVGYVHARGLKVGIYADAGTSTCAGYPGSLGREKIDAKTFDRWGIDSVDYDDCNGDGVPAQQRFQAMADALQALHRHIVYRIGGTGVDKPWEWADGMADTWRIADDNTDTWASVRSIGRQLMQVANGYTSPGFVDGDVLEMGNGGLSLADEQTEFSLWALYGSPLFLGEDPSTFDDNTLALVTNRDVIAVDQEAAGHPVRQVSADSSGDYVLARDMNDGSVVIARYNEADGDNRITTTPQAAGLPAAASYDVKNLWTGTEYSLEGPGAVSDRISAHGVILLRVRPHPSS